MENLNLVLIRLNANTFQFENTEFSGHITRLDLIKELEKKEAPQIAFSDLEFLLLGNSAEKITIEVMNNNKVWFFYIIK